MSDRALQLTIAVLAAVGLAISVYLTYIHYSGTAPLCFSGGDCETVQASRYAKIGGVPVALLGSIGYAMLLISVFVRGETARLAGAGVALVGFGFSAYLTYREIFTIKAICQWCVASAVILTVLAVLTIWRLLLLPDAGKPAHDLWSDADGEGSRRT